MVKEYFLYPREYCQKVKNNSSYLGREIVSAGVILQLDKRIILQLRDNKRGLVYSNMWGVFGGQVEEKECPSQAAVREMEEELNITLTENEIKSFFEYDMPEGKGGNHLFLANVKPHLEDMIVKEGQRAGIFSRKEMRNLPNLVPHLDKYFDILWGAIEERT
ncbi:MAG: NUDIX domain-containing protein [Nanoarchaeota archaeon]|nr:NUDIX domain-containing protein [Nanoarchaeota archaeon]MBU2459312.1 NUDIX domain-containing protein [Nanoarchaeota archaeon]